MLLRGEHAAKHRCVTAPKQSVGLPPSQEPRLTRHVVGRKARYSNIGSNASVRFFFRGRSIITPG